MARTLKFHIYDKNHCPLCWESKALEFNTRDDVVKFLHSLGEYKYFERYNLSEYYIKKDILYYDGGYIDASGCELIIDCQDREFLVQIVGV